MLKKLTVLFAFALFVLVVSWAVTPVQAGHCKGKHKNDPGCDGNGGNGGNGGSEADPAILTINDSFGGTPAVVSDFELSGRNFYVDQQLDLDADGVADDPCVVSTVSNTGLYWADMVANCGEPDFLSPRTYILRFFSREPCDELLLDVNNDFPYVNPIACQLEAQRTDGSGGNARIRAHKMFSGKRKKPTDMAFLFVHRTNDDTSYEVQTDEDVPVVFSNNGNAATATYSGTATMHEVAGPKGGFVSNPFPFPFELTVTRCPDGICP